MPARGKARQGEGDAHEVRVREVARRSQGQAAEQLHAAPEADSNLCTAPFCADAAISCAQKPPRFAGLLVVSGRPLRSVSTAEGPLRRAESASASVDASCPSFSSLKFYAQSVLRVVAHRYPRVQNPVPKDRGNNTTLAPALSSSIQNFSPAPAARTQTRKHTTRVLQCTRT